jgi:hypothetical protein
MKQAWKMSPHISQESRISFLHAVILEPSFVAFTECVVSMQFAEIISPELAQSSSDLEIIAL